MEWKSFVEQSKWLTLTRVKETHRGFDIGTGGDMHGGERKWDITKNTSLNVDCTEDIIMNVTEIKQ